MIAIYGSTVGNAWSQAVLAVLEAGGKAPNVAVAIAEPTEDVAVRAAVDGLIAEQRAKPKNRPWPVSTVANTIFPAAYYNPARPDAEERLYELHAKSLRVHSRRTNSDHYFDRMVRWPLADGTYVNQLDVVLGRLRTQLDRKGPLSSEYEIGLAHPDADVRIQVPGTDTQYMHFPCLSHISLTVVERTLHMAATYRNQFLVTRGYGNYLGLWRLLTFFAQQTKCEAGELMCLATHADAEVNRFGKGRLVAAATVHLDARDAA